MKQKGDSEAKRKHNKGFRNSQAVESAIIGVLYLIEGFAIVLLFAEFMISRG